MKICLVKHSSYKDLGWDSFGMDTWVLGDASVVPWKEYNVVISFPFFINPDITRDLTKPTNEPCVFLDSHHNTAREYEDLCGLPVKCAPSDRADYLVLARASTISRIERGTFAVGPLLKPPH